MPGIAFFLVAPAQIDGGTLLACATAATRAGQSVSILLSPTQTNLVGDLQRLGLAVLLNNATTRDVHYARADGLHLWRNDGVTEVRGALKNESLGVFAATSRHHAMEAAEAGADYVAFAQNAQTKGEPLIAWWQSLFEIPVVAFDPVEPQELKLLLTQKPDFVRPSDAMWNNP
jgi:thiamine-phosphate pyrophosphorylase